MRQIGWDRATRGCTNKPSERGRSSNTADELANKIQLWFDTNEPKSADFSEAVRSPNARIQEPIKRESHSPQNMAEGEDAAFGP